MSKNITIHKVLSLDSYGGYQLNIVIAKNIVKARNKFHKSLNGLVSKNDSFSAMHSCGPGEKMESFIFLPPDVRVSIVCHESFHATIRIMDLVGAKLNKSSEECYAYLLDHIVEFIINLLKEI